MHESKKILRLSGGLQGTLEKVVMLVALAALLDLVAVTTLARSERAIQKKDIADRIEEAIAANEPEFKAVSMRKIRTGEDPSRTQGWKSARDVVSATSWVFSSAEEGAAMLEKIANSPRSAPVHVTKLKGFGDEAYLNTGGYSKEGYTEIQFRRGSVVIMLSSSSLEVAERFVKYMVAEIDKQ